MKSFLRPTLTAAALVMALGMTSSAFAQSGKSSTNSSADKAKVSYIVGYQLSEQIPAIMRDELDPSAVGRAVAEALQGKKPTMTDEQAKQIMVPFMTKVKAKYKAEMDKLAAKNKAEGDAFLAKNKKAPGVKTTASGLQYKVISAGHGARPGPKDTVKINYTGSFIDGQVFDASSKHPGGGPTSLPIENVIPGFREGLELMQTGAHYKLYIPSSLAYGAETRPPMPPNATLIFDVTLVSTGPTPAGADNGSGGK